MANENGEAVLSEAKGIQIHFEHGRMILWGEVEIYSPVLVSTCLTFHS